MLASSNKNGPLVFHFGLRRASWKFKNMFFFLWPCPKIIIIWAKWHFCWFYVGRNSPLTFECVKTYYLECALFCKYQWICLTMLLLLCSKTNVICRSHSLWVEYGEVLASKMLIPTGILYLLFNNFNTCEQQLKTNIIFLVRWRLIHICLFKYFKLSGVSCTQRAIFTFL